MAGVTGGGGHLADVLVEGAAGLVDGDRRQPLHLRLAGDHLDPAAALLLGGAGRDLRDAHRVGVVGQQHHLARAARVDRLEELSGRGPPSRPAVDDDGAGLLEQRGQAGTGRHGHHRALTGRSGREPGLGDLLGEVGDAHPVRAAGLDAGLDGRAHVVDVDVDVPQAPRRRPRRALSPRVSSTARRRATASSSASRRYITS